MRTIAYAALIGCLVGLSASTSVAQTQVPWLTDWRQARDAAQQQNRLVLLHFYSDQCLPCKRLEHNVFNRPEVVRAITSAYVPVKINVDHHPQLANFYRINSWPTDVIVGPDGKELSRGNSPQDPNRYIGLLDNVRAHFAVGREAPPRVASSQLDRNATFRAAQQSSQNEFVSAPTAGETGASAGQQTNEYGGNFRPSTANQPAATPAGQGSTYIQNQFAGPASGASNPPPQDATPRYGQDFAGGQDFSGGQGQSALQGDSGTPATPGTNDGSSFPQGTPPGMTDGTQGYAPAANAAAGNTGYQPADGTSETVVAENGYGDVRGGDWQGSTAAAPSWGVSPGANAGPAYGQDSDPVSPAASQDSRPAAAGTSSIAMDGYCPVTLVQGNRWMKGDARWGAHHRGRTYLFTGQAEQQQFLADPDRFAPVLSGYDPVRYAETGQLTDGKREHGVFYGNVIYLFADEMALDRFSKHPDFYVSRARQAMQGPANIGSR